MGCQTEVTLGDNLTFTITTHDPDTGVLTDADGPPVYRVYEDEVAAAILTGTMTTLDPLNTVGFYSELIACTVANGFEDGRSYNIYIEATVDGDTGGISYGFRCIQVVPCATPVTYTYTVTNSGTGLPMEGVDVWITTDVGGANVVWCGVTDTFGAARDLYGNLPVLDVGTYQFFRQRAGYLFANPDAEVVS